MIAIIIGLTVFILGQFFLKVVIEPIKDYLTVISKIETHLIYYEKVSDAIPWLLCKDDISVEQKSWVALRQKEKDEASKEIKKLMAEFLATKRLIPFYSIVRKFFFNILPHEGACERGSRYMSELSIGYLSKDCTDINIVRSQIIRRSLMLRIENPISQENEERIIKAYEERLYSHCSDSQ